MVPVHQKFGISKAVSSVYTLYILQWYPEFFGVVVVVLGFFSIRLAMSLPVLSYSSGVSMSEAVTSH